MNVLLERLETLRVRDAMCGRVVEIPEFKTMAEAAEILTKREVSAAPVVDEQGRCIGILSTTDFTKCVAAINGPTEADAANDDQRRPPDWKMQSMPSYDEPVTDYMTSAVQTVEEATPLVTASRMMCAQHYHRLVVLDPSHRPVGIISTMDIVAALVHLADEAERFSPR